jgi:SAM-dependent methyltransferase
MKRQASPVTEAVDDAGWFEANRANWDERVQHHIASDFYDMDAFRAGAITVPDVEREEVGDVAGKSLLHLQCHFGQDTLSWARLGATVTGLDFSGEAIAAARSIAEELSIPAEFVEANVYDAPQALEGRQFDIVYTSLGVLTWLPDIERWAQAAAACVRPGGLLYLRDGHPFAWVFDDEHPSELRVRFPYWSVDGGLRFDYPGSYATGAETQHNVTYESPHALGDIVTALVQAGLAIEFLHEFNYASYRAFPFMEQSDDGNWRLPAHADSVPLIFSIRAHRPE